MDILYLSKKYANIYKKNKCKCIKNPYTYIHRIYIQAYSNKNAKLIKEEHYKSSRNISIHKRKSNTHTNTHRDT